MVRKLFYAYLEIKQALCIARTYYRIEAQLMWYVLNLLSLPGNCAKWKSFRCRGGNMELVMVVQSQSCVQLLQPLGLQPTRLLCSWDFPGKNTRVGCHFLLQEIFLTQGSNQHPLYLLHWQEDSLLLVPHRKPMYVYEVKVLVLQSCLTLSHPMKCSPPWNYSSKNTAGRFFTV